MDKQIRGFENTDTEHIGQMVEQLVDQAVIQRRKWERRWYDNFFFDDGYHFRVISRKTGRVIDTIGKLTGFVERAIPRASLQIRGVSNLLYSAEPYPVVYPERISVEQFRNQLGQIDIKSYQQAIEASKETARKRGIYLTTEWEDQDLAVKLIDMMLMAAKGSISFMQVYSDPDKQHAKYELFDSFDVILFGDRRSLSECPFVTKTKSMTIGEVQTNPLFEEAMIKRLQPDNKYATSEIKDAYMRARYGTKMGDKEQATIMVKETFLKEYLSEANWQNAVTKDAGGAMEGKSRGDMIMRHVFSAGGVTLRDEYIDYDDYPFAYFRFEPGPLYHTPFIERFIPQNKSVDIVVTRLEKWVNAMIVGIYQKRKGENMQISNFPGGQVVEYETTPLAQMNMSTVGNTPFQVLALLNKFIDEQGASTAALSQLPEGVKSGIAIESLKATDYANLKIPTLMLKKCIKTIATLTLERAHKDFLEPKEVEYLNDSEPDYFDVIGKRGFDLSHKINKPLPEGIIPIDKDAKIRIEIEAGLGLTMDGKRQTMQQIINFMLEMAKAQLIPPDAIKIIVKRFLETFGFGSTQEFMEALEAQPNDSVDEETLQKMKIALLETMKDAGTVGPQKDQSDVLKSKIGVLEAMKEAGLLDGVTKPVTPPKISESISYKDAPEDIKRQMEAQAGFRPSSMTSPAGSEQIKKHVETVKAITSSPNENGKTNVPGKKGTPKK